MSFNFFFLLIFFLFVFSFSIEKAHEKTFISSSRVLRKFLMEGMSMKNSYNAILLEMYFKIFPLTLSFAEI